MGCRRVDLSIVLKHDRIRGAASGAVGRRNFHVLVNDLLARFACGFTSGRRHETAESVPCVEAIQIDYFDVVSFCRELYHFLVRAFAEEQKFGVRGIPA